jgi:hypothetical protein
VEAGPHHQKGLLFHLSAALHMLSFKNFDSYCAAEPRVPCLPHFSHPSSANGREDFVRAEFGAGCESHFFTREVQLRTTVIGVEVVSNNGFRIRKRSPSGVTEY